MASWQANAPEGITVEPELLQVRAGSVGATLRPGVKKHKCGFTLDPYLFLSSRALHC